MFCRAHEAAPAAQRGGWLSAERRRRKLLAAQEAQPVDASNITKRLWIGSKPPHDRDLPELDTVVLCAQEYQPQMAFHGTVIRCRIPDAVLSPVELRTALAAGQVVGEHLKAGKRVLVTCYAGLNRSSLVAALGLSRVTRMAPDEIVELIRARRHPTALHNRHFVEIIQRFAQR